MENEGLGVGDEVKFKGRVLEDAWPKLQTVVRGPPLELSGPN